MPINLRSILVAHPDVVKAFENFVDVFLKTAETVGVGAAVAAIPAPIGAVVGAIVTPLANTGEAALQSTIDNALNSLTSGAGTSAPAPAPASTTGAIQNALKRAAAKLTPNVPALVKPGSGVAGVVAISETAATPVPAPSPTTTAAPAPAAPVDRKLANAPIAGGPVTGSAASVDVLALKRAGKV